MSKSRFDNAQRGMATFAVTAVLMIVISLIVVGFSMVARRIERQALDRQLSQQATYAAEAGADMASAIMLQKIRSGTSLTALPEKRTCAEGDPVYKDVQFSSTVKVTCLLVRRNVDSLRYSNVTDGAATVVPITTRDSSLGEVTLEWGINKDNAGCINDGNYTRPEDRANWKCNAGILRIDIAPLANGDPNAFAKTVFVYPYKDGASSSIDYVTTPNGSWANGRCAGRQCRITITGLRGTRDMFLAVRSLYENSDLFITGRSAGGGEAVFTGQAVVDVTAKAEDVLKRIQVRVPLIVDSTTAPGFAVQSQDSLCKKYSIAPDRYNDHGSAYAGCSD